MSASFVEPAPRAVVTFSSTLAIFSPSVPRQVIKEENLQEIFSKKSRKHCDKQEDAY